MERQFIKIRGILLLGILFLYNSNFYAQVENQYYYSFNQYLPYCNDPATPTQGYVFENSNGQTITSPGISGFFSPSGFPLSRYKMTLKFGSGPEVSTSYFSYAQGAGVRNDFFFINQSSYTCELKGTNTGIIDDPVYINTLYIEPLIELSSSIQYTPFIFNPFSKPVGTSYLKPVLQYAATSGIWYDVPTSALNPAGGTVTFNPSAFLKAQDLYKDLRFRILKRIGNAVSSLSYGNTSLVVRFYDTVTVKISYGGNIQCQNSSLPLQGGFKHFPDASPNAQLEVKLATEPESAWKTLSKILTDSISLFYSDIRTDPAWLGKEIILRPYKLFNGNKIYGSPVNFMFLPEMSVTYTAVAPKCHQGTDGQIRLDFPSLTNLGGKSVPIWITIYKYDKYPLTDTGVFYQPIYLDGELYYFNSGLTIQTTITQNYYVLKSGTYNSQPYLMGAGLYKIKAGFSDSALCLKEFIFRLTDPPELVSGVAANLTWGKPPLTYQIRTGENVAQARYTITGGTRPYSYLLYGQTYLLSPGDSTGSLSLLPGTNIISFADAHGCKSSNTIIIRKPPDIAIQNINVLPVKCNLSNLGDHGNGEINFTINGGVAPYKAILYRSGQAVYSENNLISGMVNQFTGSSIITNSQYQLYITDTTVNQSSPYIKKSSFLSVGQPEQLISALKIFPSLCFNEKAALSVSVTGGTGIKEISLENSGFSTDSSFRLDPGRSYSIVIRDDNLCSISCSADIPPGPPELTCDIDILEPSCLNASNGSVELNPAGGSPFDGNLYQVFLPYFSTIPEKTNRLVKTGLQPGSIAFEIQDKNGCLLQDTVNLPASSNPPAFKSIVTTDESCTGKINGSFTCTINPGDRSAPPYVFTLFDSLHIKVSETSKNSVSLQKSGLSRGLYYLKFTDSNNCSDDTLAEIRLHPSQLATSEPLVENARCPGTSTGAVSVSAFGGISLNGLYYFTLFDSSKNQLLAWNGNPFVDNELREGYYSVMVQDDSACSVTRQFRIISTEGIESTTNTGFVRNKGFPEGIASFVISKGNGSFLYNLFRITYSKVDSLIETGRTNREIGFDSLYGGKYFLEVMDTAGCLYNGSPWLKIPFEIYEPEFPLKIQCLDIHHITCHGSSNGKFRLSATGGWGTEYRYSIDSFYFSTREKFDSLPAGIFRCYAMDTAGVMSATTLVIREPDSLVTSLDTIISPPCSNDHFGKMLLNITGGTLPYLLSSDSIHWVEGRLLDTVPAGLQKIYAKDGNQCMAVLSANISSPPELHLNKHIISASSCLGADGSIQVGISGGTPDYTYAWSGDSANLSGDSLIKNLTSGKYLLRITDSHACVKEFTFYVSDSSSLQLADFTSTDVSCYGFSDGTAFARAEKGQAPYHFKWGGIPGYNEIRGLPAGPSILQVTDSAGCSIFFHFTIGSPDSMRIIDPFMKDANCVGINDGEIRLSTFGGTAPYRFLWNGGTGSSQLTRLAPGEYLLTLIDAHNCSLLESFTIGTLRQLKPGLGPDIRLCAGNDYLLDGGVFSWYRWKNDSILLGEDRYLSVSRAGNYFLEVQDEEGCNGFDTLTLALSQTSFDASLLASTTVRQGDTLILLETSWPPPDSVHWETGCAQILAATPWSRLICFTDTGRQELKITGFFGNCLDADRKLIQVIPNFPDKEILKKQSLIQAFKAYPNPAVQILTVTVELAEQSKALLRLVRIADGALMQVQQVRGPGRFEIPMKVQGLASGFYSLQLVAGEEQKSLTIAVK
ncbi:MAG: SprB repeat-containing protein [Bacteroidales bacterium]